MNVIYRWILWNSNICFMIQYLSVLLTFRPYYHLVKYAILFLLFCFSDSNAQCTEKSPVQPNELWFRQLSIEPIGFGENKKKASKFRCNDYEKKDNYFMWLIQSCSIRAGVYQIKLIFGALICLCNTQLRFHYRKKTHQFVYYRFIIKQ